MLTSAFLTQIMQYSHVELSKSHDVSEFGSYTLRPFKRTVCEYHIAKSRWDSSFEILILCNYVSFIRMQ